MPFPKLSPLQSRFAASFIASIVLLVLYFAFSTPHFVYAAEVDSIRGEDHNHERLLVRPFLDLEYEDLDMREEVSYEAEFLGVDRAITPRATTDLTGLTNNAVVTTNIQLGQTVNYMFSNASLWSNRSPPGAGLPSQFTLEGMSMPSWQEEEDSGNEGNTELKRRQSVNQRTLYITVTACLQPKPVVANTSRDPAPQLKLYVSQSENNTNPGPTQNSDLQDMIALDGGYALYQANATGNVFIGVYGENNTAYTDVWSAQIAASIDAPFHYFWNSSDPNLFLVDSDDSAALFYTNPFISSSSNTTLYEEWMDATPPFVIYANDGGNNDLDGLQNSYCGLQNAQIKAESPGQTTSQIVTGMTSTGAGNLPKQQFYMNGLSARSSYNAILAMNGNSTASGANVVGGGGQVFRMTNFNTLTGRPLVLILAEI